MASKEQTPSVVGDKFHMQNIYYSVESITEEYVKCVQISDQKNQGFPNEVYLDINQLNFVSNLDKEYKGDDEEDNNTKPNIQSSSSGNDNDNGDHATSEAVNTMLVPEPLSTDKSLTAELDEQTENMISNLTSEEFKELKLTISTPEQSVIIHDEDHKDKAEPVEDIVPNSVIMRQCIICYLQTSPNKFCL